jgi:hypothetical protein
MHRIYSIVYPNGNIYYFIYIVNNNNYYFQILEFDVLNKKLKNILYTQNENIIDAYYYGNIILHPNGKIYILSYDDAMPGNILEYDVINNKIIQKKEIDIYLILIYSWWGSGTYSPINNKIYNIYGDRLLEYDPETNKVAYSGKLANADNNTYIENASKISLAPNGQIYIAYSLYNEVTDIHRLNIRVMDPETRKVTVLLNEKMDIRIFDLIYHPITKLLHLIVCDYSKTYKLYTINPNTNEINFDFDVDFNGYHNFIIEKGTLAPNSNIYYMISMRYENKNTILEFNPINKTFKEFPINLSNFEVIKNMLYLILHPNGKLYSRPTDINKQILEIDLGCQLKNPNMALSPYYNRI